MSNVSEKVWKRKGSRNFQQQESFYSPKIEEKKEFAKTLAVLKFTELMHAWFIFKGKLKKIWRCPVNQLKRFAVQ